MGNRVVNQHYVPASFLLNFTEARDRYDGKLFVLDMEKGEQRVSSPDKVASKNGIYNFLDQDRKLKIDVIEKEVLAVLEGDFAKVAKSIINDKKMPTGTEDYETFCDFMSFLLVRTLPVKERLLENLDITLNYALPVEFTEEEFEKRKQYFMEKGLKVIQKISYQDLVKEINHNDINIQNSYITSLLVYKTILTPAFRDRTWFILEADHQLDFISSDNPVGCYWSQNNADRPPPEYDDPDSEITIAIGNKIALKGIYPSSENNQLSKDVVKADQNLVACVNSRTVAQAKRYVFSIKEDFLTIVVNQGVQNIEGLKSALAENSLKDT